MQFTNKKLLDLKNLPQSKIGKNNNASLNNLTTKKPPEQPSEPIENKFSDKYVPEDEYADLLEHFLKGKYDIGYQNFENAFPFDRMKIQTPTQEERIEMLDEFETRFEVKVNPDMKMKWDENIFKMREIPEEEVILAYEEGSSSSEEESTKENSRKLTNRDS